MPDKNDKNEETMETANEAPENPPKEDTENHAEASDLGMSESEKLRAELADAKDQAVRLFADFENFRRRTNKERLETYDRAKEAVFADLLPVADNFSRAMAQAGDDPFSQGVKMVFESFNAFLKKNGVEAIEALDATFDPSIHEAVAYQPSADKAEGVIIYETRRGYRMGDRIIRPSSVIVSSGAPTVSGKSEEK